MRDKPRQRTLVELALLYLRLGTTAFGGPAAHIALMDDEIVRRRNWLSREEFLDYLGLVNLIPGPSSTEMAIQIGYRLAGTAGLVIAGVCFILPAALLVLGLAWTYVRYGALPQVGGVLYGIKAVVIAIVFQAIWNLSKTAVKSTRLAVIGALAILGSALGLNVLIVLFGAGILSIITAMPKAPADVSLSKASLGFGPPLLAEKWVIVAVTAIPFGLLPLFFFFFKVGATLFGSGYVLLAYLRTDLVLRLHWLTDKQLLDAIAVGQVTPGPVFTTATFIGYLLGGVPGAIVATFAIFVPAFFFIALLGHMTKRMRQSKTIGSFLDGVNVGALALMVVVTWYLGRTALIDKTTIGLAILSGIVLIRFKVNSTWLIAAGGIVGYVAGRALV